MVGGQLWATGDSKLFWVEVKLKGKMVAGFHAAVSAFCSFSLVSAGGGCFLCRPLLKKKEVGAQTDHGYGGSVVQLSSLGQLLVVVYCKLIQTVESEPCCALPVCLLQLLDGTSVKCSG